jgi:hypothetical protein
VLSTVWDAGPKDEYEDLPENQSCESLL